MLKKIEAYIHPSRLEGLKEELIRAGVSGMTVSDVRGFGRQRGYRADETPGKEAKLLEKTKIEIVIREEQVDRIVGIIVSQARTGNIGAGKIFILPVEDAVRIGTGELGTIAID